MLTSSPKSSLVKNFGKSMRRRFMIRWLPFKFMPLRVEWPIIGSNSWSWPTRTPSTSSKRRSVSKLPALWLVSKRILTDQWSLTCSTLWWLEFCTVRRTFLPNSLTVWFMCSSKVNNLTRLWLCWRRLLKRTALQNRKSWSISNATWCTSLTRIRRIRSGMPSINLKRNSSRLKPRRERRRGPRFRKSGLCRKIKRNYLRKRLQLTFPRKRRMRLT